MSTHDEAPKLERDFKVAVTPRGFLGVSIAAVGVSGFSLEPEATSATVPARLRLPHFHSTQLRRWRLPTDIEQYGIPSGSAPYIDRDSL
jgi:hypothetical protein